MLLMLLLLLLWIYTAVILALVMLLTAAMYPIYHCTTVLYCSQVVVWSIAGSGALYVMFGLAGYLVAFDQTKDNILNNFSPQDPSLIVARWTCHRRKCH